MIHSIVLLKIFVGRLITFITQRLNDFCSFSGRFSAVKKCVKKSTTDEIYAAKIVKKRNVQHAINELRILQLSHKHPNFVKLYQVFDLASEAIFILE